MSHSGHFTLFQGGEGLVIVCFHWYKFSVDRQKLRWSLTDTWICCLDIYLITYQLSNGEDWDPWYNHATLCACPGPVFPTPVFILCFMWELDVLFFFIFYIGGIVHHLKLSFHIISITLFIFHLFFFPIETMKIGTTHKISTNSH